MARRLPDWLKSYQAYTDDTESAPIFNKWCGISAIAAALRKKCWLQCGRLRVFPNLYTVLVAPPGVARKSQAINYVAEIIDGVPSIQRSADSSTAQGLMDSLADCVTYDTIHSEFGTRVLQHSSLFVMSREFESFLNNVGSSKMMTTLTDLFDAGEQPWKHKSKTSGTMMVPSVFLNILGATTPESLASSLSMLVFGGGLQSRILFVFGESTKRVAVPELSEGVIKLRDDLVHDLQEISDIVGDFQFSKEALEYWIDWYNSFDPTSKKRTQPAKVFDGWYSRKPLQIQKIATILSASTSSSRIIEPWDIVEAERLLLEVEESMGKVIHDFTAANAKRSDLAKINLIVSAVRQHRSIPEKHLLQILWRDMDQATFDDLMSGLVRERKIKRAFLSPEGRDEIWYHYIGGGDEVA